jgi:transposase
VEEDAQELSVRFVQRDGRRRYDPMWKDRMVAACLEPGASVSRLALDHGINANLLWKWIKKAKEVRPLPPSSTSVFIPVRVTTDRSLSMQSSALRLAKSERGSPLSSPAKVSASLPNGVNLTLECRDVEALAAIVGALGDVQAGR